MLVGGILMWIQGALLVGEFGVLDGGEWNWGAQAGRRPWEFALWLGGLATALALSRRVSSRAAFASTVLLVLQAFAATYAVVSETGEEHGTRTPWTPPPQTLFEFAPKHNVIHIVLDGFQSDFFAAAIEFERDSNADAFTGFTFYSNHAGAFPTTAPSIPAMITGRTYRNDTPIQSFIGADVPSLFQAVSDEGWEVDLMSIVTRLFPGPATNRYVIGMNFLGGSDQDRGIAALLVDLSLFRHLPHVAKPYIYNNQQWRFQSLLSRGSLGRTLGDLAYHASNGAAFLDYMAEHAMVTSRRERVYKFIHVGIPHWPIVVDQECRFTGVQITTRDSLLEQCICGVRKLGELFARFAELGIYDDALIMLTSDHGTSLSLDPASAPDGALPRIVSSSLALFAIKEPGARGPLRDLHIPTAITDVPATIAHFLSLPQRFPGTPISMLTHASNRARTFGYYHWRHAWWNQPFLDRIDFFEIQGDVRNPNAWQYRESVFAPDLVLPMKSIQPGQRESRDYLDHGWQATRHGRARPIGEVSRLFITLPADRMVRLTAELHANKTPLPTSISVDVDGQSFTLLRSEPDTRGDLLSALIKSNRDRSPISTITFQFDIESQPRTAPDFEVAQLSFELL